MSISTANVDAGTDSPKLARSQIKEAIDGINELLTTTGVNVLRYIAPAEWPAIVAGTSTTNLYAALQAALSAEPNLVFPDGLYNTGSKLAARGDACIRGVNRRGARIKGTSAITILEFPHGNFDPEVKKIRFMGAGCTGIAVATTAGPFQGYLIRPKIHDCDFDFDLSYGINADLIFARIERNTFGYYGVGSLPAPGTSGFVAIRSHAYPATANYTNLNVVRSNIFQRCGSLSVPGIDLSSGSSWLFDSNDWEQGGVVLAASNMQLLQFIGANWVEGNSATGALFTIGACNTAPVFDGLQVSNNVCDRIFEAPLDGTCRGLKIVNCELSKSGSTYVLYDTITLARTLPGNGSVEFHDNHVSGGSGSDKLVSTTNFMGGPTSARLSAIVDTTGAGSIIYCSDPGVTLSRNGTGDITLVSVSHPLASATNKVMPHATGMGPEQVRALVTNVSSVRVQGKTGAGVATDGVISIVVYGA